MGGAAKGGRHSNRYVQAVGLITDILGESVGNDAVGTVLANEPWGWGGGMEHWPTPPFRGHLRGHGRRRRPKMGLGRKVREAAGLQEAKKKGEVAIATMG